MNAKVLFNAGYIEYDVPKVEPYANRYFQKKLVIKKELNIILMFTNMNYMIEIIMSFLLEHRKIIIG